MNIYQTVVSVS